jgi:hypothetical protein
LRSTVAGIDGVTLSPTQIADSGRQSPENNRNFPLDSQSHIAIQ